MSNMLPKQIAQWSVNDVCHWLKENKFEEQMESFKEHLIDGKTLTLLDKSDISELIKQIGPRVKFRMKLSQLLASKTIYKNLQNGESSGNTDRQQQQQQQQVQQQNQMRQAKNHIPQQRYNFIQVYQPPQQYIQQIPAQQYVRTNNQPNYGSGQAAYGPGYYQMPGSTHQQNNMYNNNNMQRNRYYSQQNGNVYNSRNVNGNTNGYFTNTGQKRPVSKSSEPVLKQFINEKGERKNYWSYNEPENNSTGDDFSIKQESLSDQEGMQSNEENDDIITKSNTPNNFDDEVVASPQSKTSEISKEKNHATKDSGVSQKSTSKPEEEKKANENESENTEKKINGESEANQNIEDQEISNQNEENKDETNQNEEERKNENNENFIMEGECEMGNTEQLQNEDYFVDDFNPEYMDSFENRNGFPHNPDDSFGVEVIDVSKYDIPIKPRSENKFASIETVTNRLALRERSKIFRKSEKKWHVAVNETAYQLVKNNPHLLQNKKELRLIAEAEVRKTYRFAKGKSRSIAIPENRIASEERKKQRLTKEKISDMKRKLNAEAEIVSRKMRQCHMNLTLSGQQSDKTKTMQLREEMQRLTQEQAKIHFSMDELLAKERKLNNSGMMKQKDYNNNNNSMSYNDMYPNNYQPTQAYMGDNTYTYTAPVPNIVNVQQGNTMVQSHPPMTSQMMPSPTPSENIEQYTPFDQNATMVSSSTM